MKIKPVALYLPLLAIMATQAKHASAETPFTSCPTQAFLFQNPAGTPVSYGVNIDVGSYVMRHPETNIIHNLTKTAGLK